MKQTISSDCKSLFWKVTANVRFGDDMKNTVIVVLCLLLASCVGSRDLAPDPIDKLVERLNASNGLWINGTSPIISLPADAEPSEVLAQAVKMVGFDQGHIKTYEILNVRQVELTNVPMGTVYSAALVQSNLGMKICLFRPQKNNQWWTRWYDVEKEEPNQSTGPYRKSSKIEQ